MMVAYKDGYIWMACEKCHKPLGKVKVAEDEE